jgi:alanyl-tRNA synthetase
MLADAVEIEQVRVVMTAVEGWDAAGLKAIATALTTHPHVLAVLVSLAVPASIVVARSPDVDADASQVLRKLVSRFGGRGGGKAELAQGGGLSAPAAEILRAAREIVTSR